MLKPLFCSTLVAFALVGCSTASRRSADEETSDWLEVPKTNAPLPELEHVPEEPRLAAPPVSLPAPFLTHTNLPASFSTHTNLSVTALLPIGRWARENKFGVLRGISAAPVPAYALAAPQGVLIFQAGSLLARWNGLEFYLGFEPQLIGGQPFFHLLDLEKNIKPLRRPFEIPSRTNRVIVLDPGHGGKNAGTESSLGGANEKEFTLDWAERAGRLLATNGWQVFLTRTNDSDMALSNRVAFAEAHHADLFISFHFNSAEGAPDQNGLETYCLTPVGMPSTLKRGYADDASLEFANNAFDEQNFQLALKVHRSLMNETGLTDRGVRRARFLGVLRGQNRPAILIEGGYLSNLREARRIADPAFREKLAGAVADALLH